MVKSKADMEMDENWRDLCRRLPGLRRKYAWQRWSRTSMTGTTTLVCISLLLIYAIWSNSSISHPAADFRSGATPLSIPSEPAREKVKAPHSTPAFSEENPMPNQERQLK